MSPALGGTSVRSRAGAVCVLLSLLLCGGCGAFLGAVGSGGDGEARFGAAAAAVDSGRWETGVRALRELASRCESGEWGADAVLLLAAVEVDPRNPRPSPSAGAQLAARYLQVPDADPSSLAVARTLYLLALDLGAARVDDPFGPVPAPGGGEGMAVEGEAAAAPDGGGVRFWRVAERFDGCGERGRRSRQARLPEHPGMPLWRAVESAARARDSLAARSAETAGEAERLRLRVDSLEAELDRIRSLLQRAPEAPPPGGGSP